MTDLAPTGTDWLRDPTSRPSIETGIEGTSWAWNADRGQWVRSSAQFRREQLRATTPSRNQQSTPSAQPVATIGGTNVTGMPSAQRQQIAQEEADARRAASQQQSARAIIEDELRRWGMYTPELVDTIYGLVSGTQDIVEALIRSTIRNTTEYQTRFRGMAERTNRGLSAISEEEYLALERDYRGIMRNAGLPEGFYDQADDFVTLIGADVSPSELSARVEQGYRAIRDSDPTVLSTMRQFYGLTDGELAAYFLDPDRALPLIERQVATAQLGAAAARQGFGETLERQAFERMAAAGVTTQQAEEAYGFLAGARELLTPLERGEETLDVTESAMGLVGQSPEALQRIRTQQRRRVARFEGGGRFATSGAEVTGLQQA